MEILDSKIISKNGFTFKLELRGFPEDGWPMFNDKWVIDDNGLIKGSDHRFNCTWYKIGADVTLGMAQNEFERDLEAFDCSLHVNVSKNEIDLIDDYIIGGDYNYEEDATALLDYLILDYFDVNNYLEQARGKVKEIMENLK